MFTCLSHGSADFLGESPDLQGVLQHRWVGWVWGRGTSGEWVWQSEVGTQEVPACNIQNSVGTCADTGVGSLAAFRLADQEVAALF